MTIAHLVIGGDVAGGQLVALTLARAASARGDRVVFLVAGTRAVHGDGRARGDGRSPRRRLAHASTSCGALRLARLLRRVACGRPAHTHGSRGERLSRVAGRLAGVAVVSHIHIENHFRRNRLARAVHSALDNGSARLAARVLAVSADTRDSLVAQGYPPRLVEVVHNGIDVGAASGGRADGLRAELDIPAGAPLFGEIARLCDVKGQRELIEATALVPGVHVALVGRRPRAGRRIPRTARRRWRASETSPIVCTSSATAPTPGRCSTSSTRSSCRRGSRACPSSVLEAMAHAKPVIATPVGGTAELVVEGETGLLVPPRDPAALAEAIRVLVADPECARTLGRAGANAPSASSPKRR